MSLRILFLLLFIPLFSTAQNNPDTIITQKNIYRILLTQALTPDIEPFTITLNFETPILKNVTLSAKTGLGAFINKFGPVGKRTQISYHVYADIEARYFFSLTRRMKKGKAIENYSAPYISIQQNLVTNSVAFYNLNRENSIFGSSRTFFNLGYQKQISKIYLSAAIGIAFITIDFRPDNAGYNITPLHGGLSIGYVF